MLTAILVILIFGSLVCLHELGHFVAARRNGVEVEEFGFGFPPRLAGVKRGGVLYSFNLLPLGGFVRMKGEDETDQRPGTFAVARVGAKTKILLAGVGMNLLTALVLLYVLCVTGLPGLGSQFEPAFLKPVVTQPKQLILAEVVSGTPAAQAGLKRGDYVLSANGQKLETDQDLHNFTQEHAGQQVVLHVSQGGQERDVKVTLRPTGSKDGYLGVVSQQVYKLRYDPLSALAAAGYITVALLWATLVGVVQLVMNIPALITGLFGSSVPKAAEAAAGPVGIIFILKSISSLGWSYVVLFTANISVALAAFNVLPLPALDGGRLFVVWVQKLTGKKWSANAEARYHTIGFLALIALMILISVYDLRKYF